VAAPGNARYPNRHPVAAVYDRRKPRPIEHYLKKLPAVGCALVAQRSASADPWRDERTTCLAWSSLLAIARSSAVIDRRYSGQTGETTSEKT
jgi:hypothetical protein